MNFENLREKINLLLYDTKDIVMFWMKLTSVIVTLFGVSILVYYHGFELDEIEKSWLILGLKSTFIYYVFNFFVKILYNYKVKEFLKSNKFEAFVVIILIVEGITYTFTERLISQLIFDKLSLIWIEEFTIAFIQISFFIILITKLINRNQILTNVKLNPAVVFSISFLLIILLGSLLLMLPKMSTQEGSLGFIDSLFMSTSATCVTGLATLNVASELTIRGQFILLILIKIGGINIVAFGSFVALISKFGLGVKQHEILEDFLNKDNLLSSRGMLFRVFVWSAIFEVSGAILLYIFNSVETTYEGNKLFSSFFHSISAFNNAGLSIYKDGLFTKEVEFNYIYQLIISTLIFIGSLGFLALFDMFSVNRLRERMLKPWKGYSFSTKIALYTSIGLVVFGAITFYYVEFDNTLKNHSYFGKVVTSIFQSITTRTAGFNTVDISAMKLPALAMFIGLMFIGASSSSTGGGVKTSTLAIIWASVLSSIKGQKHAELYKRTIPTELVFRAYTVFIFFIIFISFGVFMLLIFEYENLSALGFNFFDILFEEVSAFATVGLSTGLTSSLGISGKIIIIISMFIGRIGILTIIFTFGRDILSKNYKYPKGHTMIG